MAKGPFDIAVQNERKKTRNNINHKTYGESKFCSGISRNGKHQ